MSDTVADDEINDVLDWVGREICPHCLNPYEWCDCDEPEDKEE